MLDNGFIPRKEPGAYYIYPPYPNIPKIDYYNSYFYHSTPLATNLLGGIDIRLAQNLSVNIAAGYAFRIMKVKYATWEENEDVHKKLETKHPIRR